MKKVSLSVLLHNVFSAKSLNGGKSHSFITSNFIKTLEQLSGFDLDVFLMRATSNPNYPVNLDFSARNIFNLDQSHDIKFKNFNSQLIWYKHLFLKHKKFLNGILLSKKTLDNMILYSSGEKCIKHIDEIEKLYGVTFWSVDCRLLVNKVLLNESNTQYIKTILAENKFKLSEFLIQQLLFKHQVNNFDDFSKNLNKILDDMRTTNDNGYAKFLADGISAYLIPLEFDKKIDVNERSLSPFTVLPLIDQYLLFHRMITDIQIHGRGLSKTELNIVLEICNEIDDKSLKQVVNKKNVEIVDIDSEYKEIIKSYTVGDYHKTLKQIDALKWRKDILSLIEIYAKSHVYLGLEPKNKCLFEKIAALLIDIIKCDRKAIKNIDEFELLAAKLYFNDSSAALLFTLFNLISDNDNKLQISKKNMKKNGCNVTSAHLDFDMNELWTILSVNEKDIPEYRRLKFKEIVNFDSKSLIAHYEDYSKKVVIESEFAKDYSIFLLNSDLLDLCIRFIATNCILNPVSYYFFPVKNVLSRVKENLDEYASIALCILIDIDIKRTNCLTNEFLLESYESLADKMQIERPSEFFLNKGLDSLEKYFLKFVCIPSVLDSDPNFTGTEDLKKERIAIIDLLLSQKEDIDLKKERDEIIDEISFEDIKTRYETGKIFVDIESLKRSKLERYKYYYDTLKDSLLLELKPPEEFTLISDEGNVTAIPAGDTNSLLVELLKELITDFVKNENYGLDKYLSADIRHGIFENQFRSSAEKNQLITDMDSEGNYLISNLIAETYPLINSVISNEIGNAIANFSKRFDTELSKANSWFNVKTTLASESEEGMIDFIISVNMFETFKSKVVIANNFEYFFDACIAFMWDITFNRLKLIKERLHFEFRHNVLDLILTLKHQVDIYRRRSPMIEIQEKLDALAEDINKEVSTVCEWLNVLEYNEEKIYKISSVMLACKKTFFSIHHCEEDAISISFAHDEDDARLSYKEAKPLITSIITALNNAMSYGDKKICIGITTTIHGCIIDIKNIIVEKKGMSYSGILSEIEEKIKKGDSSLNTKEGGAGIYKIYDLLNSIPERFSVEHEIQKDYFILRIMVKK